MTNLWQRVTSVRFTAAAEAYARHGSTIAMNSARSGPLAATAVAARAAERAEHAPTNPNAPATPGTGGGGGVLATIAAGVATAVGWEQALTAPLGAIPFPSLPALRVLDIAVGLPHAHNHPPNITPPNPVPIPLPSIGPVIPIPILSGASAVMINGTAAARCGDMGVGVWCGGFFPMFEIFLGSANVWTEGARQARLVVDITKHCIFSVPKPTDPPLGPMLGGTIAVGSANVLVGGMPLPSLFSLACAQLFKAAFKVGGAVFRRATARSYVDRLLRNGTLTINGAGKYADDVVDDLRRMAATPTGRSILNRAARSGKNIEIRPYTGLGHNASATPTSWDGVMDMGTGLRGPGSNVVVEHTPSIWANHATPPPAHVTPGTSSDSILNHEMNHAANATEGRMRHQNAPGDVGPTTTSDGGWDQRWKNFEEYNTVQADNAYRAENGLPTRPDYMAPLP